MLQQEFEQRVGHKVTTDFYNKTVEPMFFAYEGEKDAFCEEYKVCFNKLPEERIASIVELTTAPLIKERAKAELKVETLEQTIDEMVKYIATPAFEGDENARRAFVWAKGWKTFLYLKLKNGYTLPSDEVVRLKDIFDMK